jgi:hypothetical protein
MVSNSRIYVQLTEVSYEINKIEIADHFRIYIKFPGQTHISTEGRDFF